MRTGFKHIAATFVLLALQYAYSAPLSQLPEHSKAAFCAALLGVENDIEKRAPLNLQAITEILTRVYPEMNRLDESGQSVFPSANLYASSTQAFLHLLHQEMGQSYREVLAAFFTPQPYSDNFGSRQYFETVGANTPVRTLTDGGLLVGHYGIIQTGSSLHLPERIQVELLNEVLREVRKTPLTMRQTIERAGKHLDVVLGSVTDHPNHINLRGVRPRG